MNVEANVAKPRNPRGRRRDDARSETVRLHVLGLTNRVIAKRIGASEVTVCRWLGEPAVREQIARLNADAIERTKQKLLSLADNATRALDAVVRGRGGRAAESRRKAACDILDRIGVIKSEGRVHEGNVNLSTLTIDELRALGEEALRGL